MRIPAWVASRLWILLFLHGCVAEAFSAETEIKPDPATGKLPPLVRQALSAVDRVNLKQWAYTVSSKHGEKEMVERHNPQSGPGKTWELVTRQGKEPTEDQLKRYAKSARHRTKNPIQQFKSMIDKSSIKVVRESESEVLCEFRIKPTDDDVKLVADKLQGTMRISKLTGTLQDLEVVNTERISKFATLSIRELRVNMTFQDDVERGVTLPKTLNIKMRGRALLVKSLDFDSSALYGDMRYVGKGVAARETEEETPASP